MNVFQRKVHDGRRSLDFFFKPIITPDATKYFVTAIDINAVLSSFEMGKVEEKWTILPPAPHWIINLENELSQIIEEALQD